VDDEPDEELEDDPPLELEAGTVVVVVVASDVAVVAVVSATRTPRVGVALKAARLMDAWGCTS
jgi:hypothetical protein